MKRRKDDVGEGDGEGVRVGRTLDEGQRTGEVKKGPPRRKDCDEETERKRV